MLTSNCLYPLWIDGLSILTHYSAWAFFVQNGKSAYQEALLADEKKEEDNVEGHNNTVEHMIQSLDIKVRMIFLTRCKPGLTT
jgi:hypothetical protein